MRKKKAKNDFELRIQRAVWLRRTNSNLQTSDGRLIPVQTDEFICEFFVRTGNITSRSSCHLEEAAQTEDAKGLREMSKQKSPLLWIHK